MLSDMTNDTTAERAAVAAGADEWLDTLQDWVRIPSVSADPAHHADVAASAHFFADQLRRTGFPQVRVLDEGPWLPAVLAHWPSGDPDAVRVAGADRVTVTPARRAVTPEEVVAAAREEVLRLAPGATAELAQPVVVKLSGQGCTALVSFLKP